MMVKHSMTQVIDCIEAQKDENIGIIKAGCSVEKIASAIVFSFSVCSFIGVQ
jgi:hypothetical protein